MRPVFYSPPPRPWDEEARQQAVDASGVCARVDDPALQALAERAAALAGTPIAAVSVIDRHRQLLVGRVGIVLTETSRAASFCGHTILSPHAPLVVTDASLDRRFAGNPMVQGPGGVRFYIGMPLVIGGHALGALCVVDQVPRTCLSAADLAGLDALAREAEAEIGARFQPAARLA